MEKWKELSHIILVMHHFGRREELLRERERLISEIYNDIRHKKCDGKNKRTAKDKPVAATHNRNKRGKGYQGTNVKPVTQRTKDIIGDA